MSKPMAACVVASALALTGCASTVMKNYVGKPLQSAMLDHGPPVNAFDMPDGTRAFQWVKDRSFVMPTTMTNSGYATPIGNAVWWTQNTQITGGQPVASACAYTMFAKWDDTQKSWIFTGFNKPKWECE